MNMKTFKEYLKNLVESRTFGYGRGEAEQLKKLTRKLNSYDRPDSGSGKPPTRPPSSKTSSSPEPSPKKGKKRPGPI